VQFFKNFLDDSEFDFVGMRRAATIFSVLMVLGAWLAFFGVGPNWGIDFEGGTEIELAFVDDVQIADVRSVLEQMNISGDAVQQIGSVGDHQYSIRIKEAGFGMAEVQNDVRAALTEQFGPDFVKDIKLSVEVGARLSVLYNPDAQGNRVKMPLVMEALKGIEGAGVTEGREEYEIVVTLPGLSQQISKQVKEAFGDTTRPGDPNATVEILSVQSIGPKVGADLARDGAISVLATLGLVLLYVAFRFDLAFAPGAILALFHDVSITVGIFVLLGREFNLPIIGALLTIVGYSLNDTIVIYDRIRSNMDRYRRKDLPDLINVSINETISRTLATSLTTMLAITAFLFLGGDVIQNFALAMLCGIIFGTYSTVFVASPMILIMEEVKPALQRFVVSSDASDAADAAAVASDRTGEMTESEKRRRERAELETEAKKTGS